MCTFRGIIYFAILIANIILPTDLRLQYFVILQRFHGFFSSYVEFVGRSELMYLYDSVKL